MTFKKGSQIYAGGFTLMELVIIIGLVSVLLTAGFTAFATSRKNAEDGRRRADLETFRQSLELYRNATGAYPIYTGPSDSGTLKTALVPTYISDSAYPKDPDANRRYYYQSLLPGSTYKLCAELNTPGSGCTIVILGNTCRTTAVSCNLEVTQP